MKIICYKGPVQWQYAARSWALCRLLVFSNYSTVYCIVDPMNALMANDRRRQKDALSILVSGIMARVYRTRRMGRYCQCESVTTGLRQVRAEGPYSLFHKMGPFGTNLPEVGTGVNDRR